MLSKQTPKGGGFFYNPFAGANILLFPIDRDPQYPRVFILHPFPFEKKATACGGRVEVELTPCGQTVCRVNGKKTERYSIVYKGRRTKKMWSAS